MRTRSAINPGHAGQRAVARLLGLLLVVVGGVFAAIGLVDFFASFGRFGNPPPTKFWCAFVGLPLLAVGIALLKFGYLGAVTRYVAGETAPVVVDTVKEVARGTRDEVRDLARAASEGMRGDSTATRACAACGAVAAAEARFCDECGTPLGSPACPACGGDNDADARFCRHCGKPVAASEADPRT